jgi:hypothetical protein
MKRLLLTSIVTFTLLIQTLSAAHAGRLPIPDMDSWERLLQEQMEAELNGVPFTSNTPAPQPGTQVKLNACTEPYEAICSGGANPVEEQQKAMLTSLPEGLLKEWDLVSELVMGQVMPKPASLNTMMAGMYFMGIMNKMQQILKTAEQNNKMDKADEATLEKIGKILAGVGEVSFLNSVTEQEFQVLVKNLEKAFDISKFRFKEIIDKTPTIKLATGQGLKGILDSAKMLPGKGLKTRQDYLDAVKVAFSGNMMTSMACLSPNAFYDPSKHALMICPAALSSFGKSVASLIFIFGHELAHSIDPCSLAKTTFLDNFPKYKTSVPDILKNRHKAFTTLPKDILSDTYGDPLSVDPTNGLAACLRQKDSIGAKMGDIDKEVNIANKNVAWSRPFEEYAGGACVAGRKSAFAMSASWQADQIGESTSDWWGVEILMNYINTELMVKKMKPGKDMSDFVLNNVRSAYTLFCSADKLAKQQAGAQPGAASKPHYDPHPVGRARIRVVAVHPSFRDGVSCGSTPTNWPMDKDIFNAVSTDTIKLRSSCSIGQKNSLP